MKITRTNGTFEPTVFESEIDVLAGGVTLKDVGSFTDANGNVPAGTLIGLPDGNGKAKPVAIANNATNAQISSAVLGILRTTIKADGDLFASVVLEGTIRRAQLKWVATQITSNPSIITAVQGACPRITVVE